MVKSDSMLEGPQDEKESGNQNLLLETLPRLS